MSRTSQNIAFSRSIRNIKQFTPSKNSSTSSNGKKNGRPRLDLTGFKTGRLTVTRWAGVDRKYSIWVCRCVCGNLVLREAGKLNDPKRSHSCGCLKREPRIHGHATGGKVSRTYVSWARMVQRCTDPKSNRYSYYAGRGITVCKRWIKSFKNFLKDMGERPPDLFLERKNNDGNYKPSNCKWATRSEQMKNRRPFEHRNQWSK